MKIGSLKEYILGGFLILSACQSADHAENKVLLQKLDSANQELEITKQALMDSNKIKALLDSIDASRKVTTSNVSKELDGKNNIVRLNDINDYVKDINLKMDQMEHSIKYVNTMAASIIALRADIEARTQKIAKLEAEIKNENRKDKNNLLTGSVIQSKDSTLAAFIKNCQSDIIVLQKTMEEIHAKNNAATASLYYKQAEALASMADNMSSKAKRMFVKQEALEMYKMSLSLGKKEAEHKISVLQEEI